MLGLHRETWQRAPRWLGWPIIEREDGEEVVAMVTSPSCIELKSSIATEKRQFPWRFALNCLNGEDYTSLRRKVSCNVW